eukprot:757458-Hanusia_phi.AAC.16
MKEDRFVENQGTLIWLPPTNETPRVLTPTVPSPLTSSLPPHARSVKVPPPDLRTATPHPYFVAVIQGTRGPCKASIPL